MKTPTTTKLDTSTPKWPLLAVNLTDPTVDINGASTPLDPADPQRDAVGHATRQARALGRAVRMTVTDAAGEQRLIVTADGVVTLLDPPQATGKPGRKSNPAQKGKAKTKRRLLDRLPRPARWGLLGLGVLTAFSVVVIVTHGRAAPVADAAAPAAAPVPPAGQLYTELEG